MTFIDTLKAAAANRAMYRRTRDEIARMPRDVAIDLGIFPEDADRIARAYGTRARAWLGKDQGRDFGGGLSQAEVDYLVAEEWAVSAEDVLWRRTKEGLHMTAEEREAFARWLAEQRLNFT